MTNEEKAIQIYNTTYEQCIEDGYPKIIAITSAIMCKTGAEIVAEWKEKQMIDKACEWLKNNTITATNDFCTYVASSHNISKEEFIEQFKKAMEG